MLIGVPDPTMAAGATTTMRAPPPLHNQRQKHAFASTISSDSVRGVGVCGGSRPGFGWCFLLLMVMMGSAAGSRSPDHNESILSLTRAKNSVHIAYCISNETMEIVLMDS